MVWAIQPVITIQYLTPTYPLIQNFKCHQYHQMQTRWLIKWIDSSTSSMNASRQNWRRNTTKESIFCTKELRKSKLIKDLTKMLTSFWCKTVSMMSAKYHPNNLPSPNQEGLPMGLQIEQTISIFPEWIEVRAKKGEMPIKIYRIEIINRLIWPIELDWVKVPIMSLKVQMEWKYRRKNNITNFILIVHRKPSTWWENNIKQLKWWDLMTQMMLNSKMIIFPCINRARNLNSFHQMFCRMLAMT